LSLIKSLEGSLEFHQSLNKGFKGKASEGSYGQGLVVGSINSLEVAITLVKSYLGDVLRRMGFIECMNVVDIELRALREEIKNLLIEKVFTRGG